MKSPVDPQAILDILAVAITGDEEQAHNDLADIIATIPEHQLPATLGGIGTVFASITVTAVPLHVAVGFLRSEARLAGRTTTANKTARDILRAAVQHRPAAAYEAVKRAGPTAAGHAIRKLMLIAARAVRATPEAN